MTTSDPGPAGLEGCPPRGWRSQFGHPRGVLGRLAGHIMARKNREMHDLTAELLEVRDDDRILEVGFGHGRTVALLARAAPHGRVCGIDPSAVMVSQARHRNRRAVREGRVELLQGSVAKLPWPDGYFSAVCAINSFQHWPDPAACLAEVRRVLAPGGRLVVALRLHDSSGGRFSSPGFRPHQVAAVLALVREAGYADVRSETRALGRTVTCVLARR